MFETEEQIEKTSSGSSARFLIILLIIILVGAGVVYFIVKSQKPLSQEQATVVIGGILKAKGPAIVHFHVGTVVPSVDENPRGPHYALLEKAGYLKLTKMTGGGTRVELTPLGTDMFPRFPEFKKIKNPDGTDGYIVPLSERKLVAVNSVTMSTPTTATVEYTWKWTPNKVGDDFDASGKLAQSFSSWDRATLIQKYGVDFYHAAPQKASIDLVRGDKGWKIATD
jgi:hypothetical protein